MALCANAALARTSVVSSHTLAVPYPAKPDTMETAELWVTPDEGETWTRAAVDEEITGRITVRFERDGVYGLALAVTYKNGRRTRRPTKGTKPQQRIAVDTTAPTVELSGPARHLGGEVELQYTAQDPGPAGLAAVELHVSTNDGLTWEKLAVDRKLTNAFAINCEDGRDYALFATAVDHAGNRSAEPTTGTQPQHVVSAAPPPKLTLDQPVGGEIYVAGTMMPIRWTLDAPGHPLTIHVEISADGGQSWQPYEGEQPADGSVDWPLPADTADLLVRISARTPDATVAQTQTDLAVRTVPAERLLDAALENIRAKLADGDYARALAALDALQAQSPNAAEQAIVPFLRARARLGLKELPAALKQYQRVVERDPTFGEAWNEMSKLHYALSDDGQDAADHRQACVDALRQAKKLDAQDVESLVLGAIAAYKLWEADLTEQSDLAEARADLQRALQLEISDAQLQGSAHWYLAKILETDRAYGQALKQWSAAADAFGQAKGFEQFQRLAAERAEYFEKHLKRAQ